MSYKLLMDKNEVSGFVAEVFPQSKMYGMEVDHLEPGKIKVAMAVSDMHLRPGGTVSGPSMFTLADCATYLLILSHIGKVALAVTTNLNINFVSKPEGDLIAEAGFLKLGKRLAVCEVSIFSVKEKKLVAHATATYSIPPNR
ncbi:MAG: PaaI family thioesterase [Pseudomonadota bacterium]